MKTAFILGLGESLKEYDHHPNNITFGVNDIWSRYKTDYVICLEKPKVMRSITAERLTVIKESRPKQFFTNERGWTEFIPCVYKIELDRNIKLYTGRKFPCSNNSPFVAVAIAASMGFKEIVLYGIDFKTHWQLSNHPQQKRIIHDYSLLNEELKKKNITLYIGTNKSILSKSLPLWKK